MRIQTIAAVTDFSTEAEHALDRAALIAAQHQAVLVLAYAAEELDPCFENPQARLEQRARQLARRHEINVRTREFDDGESVVERALTVAAAADLLVIDRRAGRSWWRPWRGSALGACLRGSPCPVLVVQQPVEDARERGVGYSRMLLAVDSSPRLRDVLHYAADLQSAAAVDLFQAQAVETEEQHEVLERYRDELREEADHRNLRVKDAFHARRNRVDSHTGTRDVTRQLMVQQQRSGADLIVIGAPRDHWMDRLALSARGSRLSSMVTCDVLVCGQLPQERDDKFERSMSSGNKRQDARPQLRF